MDNRKKWLEKYASPEGAVKMVGSHQITEGEKIRLETWKSKVIRKYSLSSFK